MTAFNPARKLNGDVETFSNAMADFYNYGAAACMISIGHQLKLFDCMATLPPSTSEAIAKASKLNERYIREWLAVMVTSNIIEYDPASKSYQLPEHHAACLTREASPGNLAVTTQFVSLIAQTEPHLLKCFKSGEGLDYCHYPEFHRVMSEDSFQTVVSALFDYILPLVPELYPRLESGIMVLDAGCGAGLGIFELAKKFPNSYFKGYDLCPDAFAETAERAKKQKLTNLAFDSRDLTHLGEDAQYDLVLSFDAVHDQAAPSKMLAGIHAALKEGGIYLMQEIAGSSQLENNLEHPLAPILYSISVAHCMPVSLGQGGPGLGTMWGEELAEHMLADAGFKDIRSQRLEHDPFNTYFVSRK